MAMDGVDADADYGDGDGIGDDDDDFIDACKMSTA